MPTFAGRAVRPGSQPVALVERADPRLAGAVEAQRHLHAVAGRGVEDQPEPPGVRALTQLLDAQFRGAGIHVATVAVGGAVSPGSAFDPDVIGEEYWRLHAQSPSGWQREVLFEGRAGRRTA